MAPPCSSPAPGPARTRSRVNPSYFSPATFAALGDASGDGRVGQPLGQLTLGHRPPDADPDAAAAGLGAGSRAASRCRSARPASPTRPRSSASTPRARSCGWPRIRTRPAGEIAAKAWPVFEGRDAGRHPGGARPLRQAGRRHAPSRRARRGGRGGRRRRRRRARAELLDAAEALDQRHAHLLRRRLGGARPRSCSTRTRWTARSA